MSSSHQLIVLMCRNGEQDSISCLLARAEETTHLHLRDAALLVRDGEDATVREPVEGWRGRRPLGSHWWCGLAQALNRRPNPSSATLVEAGVSRSFLEEIADDLDSSTALALLATDVDVVSVIRDLVGDPIVRIVYGDLPGAAVDELFEMADG